ncbi:hypothetical protein LDENG_00202800 [Lucifuga dentata]|nr:hypothetical protein LDENG_00202800 [Lucifuga dentata]
MGGCGNNVRMLFIDYSSVFNTIAPPHTLSSKLLDRTQHRNWVLDFLTGRPQTVRVGGMSSKTLTLNTGAPQGCILSPLLYSLYTSECVATHTTNSIVKFADNTVVVGLISHSDDRAYLN